MSEAHPPAAPLSARTSGSGGAEGEAAWPSDVPHLPPLPEVERWAAVHTAPRAEKVVAEYLAKKRVRHYLPSTLSRRVYGTRVRHSWIPLFPGYLFYDHGETASRVVYGSRRVARIMVPDDFGELRRDLENLAGLLEKKPDLLEAQDLAPGTPVEITGGPYLGTRGELIRRRGRTQLVIRVHFINYGAVLDIDESCVRSLDPDEV